MSEPAFTLGIEEEYLLVDRSSRDLASDPPPEMLSECQARLPSRVTPEFLRAQIEVGTSVCSRRPWSRPYRRRHPSFRRMAPPEDDGSRALYRAGP
jgi:gamma-glutamyl:cysteine ligase YbdK (ATP-grasp superfamily)